MIATDNTTPCTCPGVMRTGCPCDRCHGRGWYVEVTGEYDLGTLDERELYCDCEAGARRRDREGGRTL